MFVYTVDSAATVVTSGTANTEVGCLFIKPGARNVALQGIYVHGKGAGLTAISGITWRAKRYGTTATAVGTGVALTNALLTGTIQPRDPGTQLAKTTGALNNGATVVFTVGTGGPATLLTIGCGAAGPGGWVAPNPDSVHALEGSANSSIDILHSSGTISLNAAVSLEIVE